MDSAVLLLVLSPNMAPVVLARLCLRSGFLCFTRVAGAMGYEVSVAPGSGAGISLTYQEFSNAVDRLREVDFPIERDPADAWPDFIDLWVNYEQAAYAVAFAVDAVPALWSGPAVAAPPPSRRPSPRSPAQLGPVRPSPGWAGQRAGRVTAKACWFCWVVMEAMPVTAWPAGASASIW